MEYDKPRIASTIVVGVILSFLLFLTILFVPVSWAAVKEAVDESASNADSAAGSIAAASVIAIFAGVGVAIVFIIYILIFIADGICFIFTFKNRCSTLKAIRIISYVMDGLIGLTATTAVVKIILLACGV